MLTVAPPTERMNPWIPMAVVCVSTVIITLDAFVIGVVLHPIGEDLGVDAGIEWVVTAYLLAVCASQPTSGWLSDRFGNKRVFLVSLVAFAAGSIVSGTAPTFHALLAGRAIQGLACGVLSPIGMAMILGLFPPERRGRAVAAWGLAAMVSPALGPALGGWLVGSGDWHLVFLISVPLAVIALVAGIRLLPDDDRQLVGPFDRVGLALGASGLVLFVFGVSQGGQWGWSSPAIAPLIAVSAVLLIAFVRHQRRTEHPLVNLCLFEMRDFRVPVAVLVLSVPSEYCRFVFVPLQLQEARDYTALRVGLLFMPAAVLMAVGMQIGGRLTDAVGPRRPAVAGTAVVVVSLVGMWSLDLETPLWVSVAMLALHGLGSGLAASPSLAAGIGRLPARLLSQGAALRVLSRQMGAGVAVATLAALVHTLVESRADAVDTWRAYGVVYLLAAAASATAVVVALGLPDTPDRRRAERYDGGGGSAERATA